MALRNIELLNQLFIRHFDEISQDAVMQAAIDNMIYNLTPAEQRHKLTMLNMAYVIQGFDQIAEAAKVLSERILGNLASHTAVENYDCYIAYSNLRNEVEFLINKIESRVYTDTALAVDVYVRANAKAASLEKELKDAMNSLAGSVLVDKTGEADTLWGIYTIDAVGTRTYLNKMMAPNSAQAIFDWASDYRGTDGNGAIVRNGNCFIRDCLVIAVPMA